MTLPSFSHEQALPSLKVTKAVLESLEQYLTKRFVDAALLSVDEMTKALSIRIEDSLGTEEINTIKDMATSRFADSTSNVEIGFNLPYRNDGTHLRVRLRFSKERLFSTIAINASIANAREFVLGLRDGLMRMLEPQKTWHWVAHPKSEAWAAASVVGGWVAYQLFTSTGKETYFPYLVGSSALLWFYLFGIGSLRPYVVFESRASERSDKIWSWLLGGIATFLLFGTLLTFVRRPLLGF
jgi:hypothetical protein